MLATPNFSVSNFERLALLASWKSRLRKKSIFLSKSVPGLLKLIISSQNTPILLLKMTFSPLLCFFYKLACLYCRQCFDFLYFLTLCSLSRECRFYNLQFIGLPILQKYFSGRRHKGETFILAVKRFAVYMYSTHVNKSSHLLLFHLQCSVIS